MEEEEELQIGGGDVDRTIEDKSQDTRLSAEVGCGYYDLVWTISDIFKVGNLSL